MVSKNNNRLPEPYGKLIDRKRQVSFSFEGQKIIGYHGDSIASALWAEDIKMISRSFKYHRPRGVMSMTGQDANTLVQLLNEGNVSADHYQISTGLEVKGQHYWGSLKNDLLAVIGKFSRFLPVGFYYKAFYRYNTWDTVWSKVFRHLTGLGKIDPTNSDKEYDKQYLFYDVVIVGAGISGMTQAISLAQKKIKVLLVDQSRQLGGRSNFSLNTGDDLGELKTKINDLADKEKIDLMLETVCNAVYTDNWLSLIKDNRMYKVRAKQFIVAAGCFEQPIVFHNNDLPGIMLGSAALRLMHEYGVKPGNTAVIASVDDSGYELAVELLAAGVDVKAIVDLRPNTNQSLKDTQAFKELAKHKVEIFFHHAILSASKTNNQLSKVKIGKIKSDGELLEQGSHIIACDLLCVNGGNMPAYQLPCFLGSHLTFDDKVNQFEIKGLSKDVFLIGTMVHADNLDLVKEQIEYTTAQVLSNLGIESSKKISKPEQKSKTVKEFVFPIFKHAKGKEFIDFDEDLQVCDVINSVREGYEDIQLVKRFSTLGMGPSQGRYSAFMSAYLVANFDKNRAPGEVVTTARPPFTVEKMGHQAGRSFFPERHSSMHHRHIEAGAQPLIAGVWIRPAYYGAKDAMDECVKNESLAVRNNVGIVDVSTLGGIEIRGPDAAEFVNRLYTWNFLKQPIGRARYALLTNEQGVVIDDGVACRFSEEDFYVTATTGGVENVYLQMMCWNAQWRLDVDITNVTSSWCGANVAGPNSRQVLSKLCQDVDLSAEAFPYMGVREGTVAGISARLIRVGFVGELGYEIHVPQHMGEALWDALIEAGKEFGIMPFGIETQRLLRLEKGHIIISQDTDAITHPEEVHMGWAVGMKKPFFVGQKAIEILDEKPLDRKLVGFEVLGSKHNPVPKVKESHLCFDANEKLIGRVTSVGESASLGKSIGLAYIKPEFSEVGMEVAIRCDNKQNVDIRVVALPFYDPKNERQLL